ncbi:MAG: class II aldolase/adducin family protein, partial [Clostridia bacterium]|nr:class II aldolase/adducin family protein [Clostridia bacterium]
MLEKLKLEVWRANMLLRDLGLVINTWGNVSGRDPATGLIVIKPSGVEYGSLKPGDLPVLTADGEVVEGGLRPSSDTPTHLEIYREFPGINGIAHTHSVYATVYAQALRDIPPLGTTHADYFPGPVPVTRRLTSEEIAGEYELNTGRVIAEKLKEHAQRPLRAVLVASHGPF